MKYLSGKAVQIYFSGLNLDQSCIEIDQSIAENFDTVEHIIDSMITGKAQNLPEGYRSLSSITPDDPRVPEFTDAVRSGLSGVSALNDITPAPIPVSEFCARPENINLKGLCK